MYTKGNTTIIGIVIVLILIIGGIWYAVGSDDKESRNVGGDAMEDTGTFAGSLADLQRRGGNWTCTVLHETDEATSQGTVYVAGDTIRTDFTSTVAGVGAMTSHMITDAEFVHTWTDETGQGFTMPVQDLPEEEPTPAPTPTQQTAVSYNQTFEYECEPWSPDASMFTLPDDITFMSMPTFTQ